MPPRSLSNHTLAPFTLGLVGFGAFGRLMARHLAGHVSLCACDPALPDHGVDEATGTALRPLAEVAACPVVVLAMPVEHIGAGIAAVAPHLRPGVLVLDVGSVKLLPAAAMLDGLPDTVDIVATHPLFGPQSAADSLAGHRIALCPVRGRRWPAVVRFLKRLGLDVIVTTADQHDRDLAVVQGLTHLVAQVLLALDLPATRLTTPSYEHLMHAVGMVRHDSAGVLRAIEVLNPYAGACRDRFFAAAETIRAGFETEDRPQVAAPAPAPAIALDEGVRHMAEPWPTSS